jgi:hypothetical protein
MNEPGAPDPALGSIHPSKIQVRGAEEEQRHELRKIFENSAKS